MSNNKWNKNALGYGEKTNSSLNDCWNKNALKYDSKNDLDNPSLSLKNDKHGNDHWNKCEEYEKNIPLNKDSE